MNGVASATRWLAVAARVGAAVSGCATVRAITSRECTVGPGPSITRWFGPG